MFSNWQDLLGLLEGYGFEMPEGGWGMQDLPDIGSGNIKNIMDSMFGFGADSDILTENMFSPITSQQINATMGKTYSPLMESATSQGTNKLLQSLSSKKANQAAGGFSGSGQFKGFETGARDVYGKGLESVLGNIGSSRGQAMGSLTDLMQGWKRTAASLAGSPTDTD